MTRYVIPFTELRMTDVEQVGGKNASLGEMISQLPSSVRVPGGFATTAAAYREFLAHGGLAERINAALDALNVDEYGLDEMDNRILTTIIDKFKGGPVGLKTIATAVGEDEGTIEEVYEPFLIQEGFLMRTSRGRECTELAYKHLGKTSFRGNTLF